MLDDEKLADIIAYVRQLQQEYVAGGGKIGGDAEPAPAVAGPEGRSLPGQPAEPAEPKRPSNVHIFFGIYFLMTGLHGIHVLAGMAVISWLLVRSIQGAFGSSYFTPVDLGGLYWHLVDLIWIFLFPLLYLIT